MRAVKLGEKRAACDERRAPRIVAGCNGSDVAVAKLQGAFVWHGHPETDDFFPALKGELGIERGRTARLDPAAAAETRRP